MLRNEYVLIIHMGRSYPFDLVGRAFNTLPYEDANNNTYLTNFDLLFNFINQNVAQHSDPGFYVCSTDMILNIPNDGGQFTNSYTFLYSLTHTYFLKKLFQ